MSSAHIVPEYAALKGVMYNEFIRCALEDVGIPEGDPTYLDLVNSIAEKESNYFLTIAKHR